MGVIESKVRELGKKYFIKFRNRKECIIAYFPDGVTRRSFYDWGHAYVWVLQVDKTKIIK